MKVGEKKKTESSSRSAAKKSNRVSDAVVPVEASSDLLIPILITPQLKQKAKHYLESFWQIDYYQESIDICTVTVHCQEARHAETILNYAKAQERFFQQSLPSPPEGFMPMPEQTVPRPSLEAEAASSDRLRTSASCGCTVANLHALRLDLEALADKITQTNQSNLAVNGNLLTVLSQFTDAFSKVISFTVWSSWHENSHHDQEDAIKNAHSGALAFAAALLAAQLPQPLARVDINVDLSIGINGTAQNLNATLKRQLFVLAFLRDRPDFSLKEYSALYGNGSGEARKEFDQNNRKISGTLGLPERFWRATPGRRTVDCIEWNVSASQADLAQFLKENAGFPEKWSLPDGNVSA